MKPTLIAEIGNCHWGEFDTATEMIRLAKQSGADLVKFQAIVPEVVIKFGSMPESFYRKVAFTLDEYMDLIEVGLNFKIPVFFSTFGGEMQPLWAYTFYHKVSAKQSPTFPFNDYSDKPTTFVSVNPFNGKPPHTERCSMLYATDYLPKDAMLEQIDWLSDYYQRPVGYSDHTVGILNCIKAVRDHGANVVEKHFTLDKNFCWQGTELFRDTVHASTPKEFEELARSLK